jgi:hypothetical protein
VTLPGDVVLGGCILQHWIFPRTHGAFHVCEFNQCYMRPGGRFQNGHILLGMAELRAQREESTGKHDGDIP